MDLKKFPKKTHDWTKKRMKMLDLDIYQNGSSTCGIFELNDTSIENVVKTLIKNMEGFRPDNELTPSLQVVDIQAEQGSEIFINNTLYDKDTIKQFKRSKTKFYTFMENYPALFYYKKDMWLIISPMIKDMTKVYG